LLRAANLNSPRVYRAQQNLIQEIRRKLEEGDFVEKFGRGTFEKTVAKNTLWESRLANEAFQLHESKMTGELSSFLVESELAWSPRRSHGAGYVEMSPQLGNAVMATLAFACAEDEPNFRTCSNA
jgi:hypothetical protein